MYSNAARLEKHHTCRLFVHITRASSSFGEQGNTVHSNSFISRGQNDILLINMSDQGISLLLMGTL